MPIPLEIRQTTSLSNNTFLKKIGNRRSLLPMVKITKSTFLQLFSIISSSKLYSKDKIQNRLSTGWTKSEERKVDFAVEGKIPKVYFCVLQRECRPKNR